MILSQEALLKLVHDTKAVSVWNHKTGPVFWYTAGVPGPFFVNTEYLIGADIANSLVSTITEILSQTDDPAVRVARIDKAVMEAYVNNKDYKNLIETMVAEAQKSLPARSFTIISGGERRDWLFSVPFAHVMGLSHVYLFKDQSAYCGTAYGPEETALHVADLINNAASYVDKWLPALGKAKIKIDTTLVVTVRGTTGIDKLKEQNVKIIALNNIDLSFFEKWMKNGLIDQETYDELAVHFQSPQAWAEKYLIGREELFKVSKDSGKAYERVRSFFTKDPWNFYSKYPEFFDKIRNTFAA